MNRRKTLKILGGSVIGVAGLALVDWKWNIVDRRTHDGFFTSTEEKLISSIADTIIPEGLPSITPNKDAQPIGALSTGTDKYLSKVFEHCYEKEDQEIIKKHLAILDELSQSELRRHFYDAPKEKREAMFLSLATSGNEEELDFFNTIKSETITGFTTAEEVMVEYRNYKVAPGFYHGCADLPSQT